MLESAGTAVFHRRDRGLARVRASHLGARESRVSDNENAVFKRGRRASNRQPSDRQSEQGVCKYL